MRAIFTILLCLLQFSLWAQTKDDVILKTDGQEITGKVTGIEDQDVKFMYKGETLPYSIKKNEIEKITFGSGRIEFYNKPQNRDNAAASVNHFNKIAILPFDYLIDKQDAGQEMTFKVQNEAYSFLRSHVGVLTVQDPATTNALLIKAGVNGQTIRGFTMGELCNILGVEYVVQGAVTQNKTSVTNYSSSSADYDKKGSSAGQQVGNVWGTVNNDRGKASSSTYSTAQQNYTTAITMNVYTDKGANIFSQDHTSLWNVDDAYKITLQYLLKRTPLYKK